MESLQLIAQVGFPGGMALLLLKEMRDIRESRVEERENWRKALENNTEALREIADRMRGHRRPRHPLEHGEQYTDGGEDQRPPEGGQERQ